MTVRELVAELQRFNQDLEVTITDGMDGICYHTNGIEVKEFQFNGVTEIDVGVGGCRLED